MGFGGIGHVVGRKAHHFRGRGGDQLDHGRFQLFVVDLLARLEPFAAVIPLQPAKELHARFGETTKACFRHPAPPAHGEPIVAKPGKSAFIGSDFDQILRRRGVRNLVFAGITTDGAVQCTLRDANDRGYECLILEDATASDIPSHHADQIYTLALAGGHYGSIAKVSDFAAALASEVTA